MYSIYSDGSCIHEDIYSMPEYKVVARHGLRNSLIPVVTVLGPILAGLLMGKALHAYVMAQVQIDSMFFPCRISPLSYALSFLMTMLFSFCISLGMRPRLRRIDMAESLKSIE